MKRLSLRGSIWLGDAIGSNADLAANNLTDATAIGAKVLVGQSNALILGSIKVKLVVNINLRRQTLLLSSEGQAQ